MHGNRYPFWSKQMRKSSSLFVAILQMFYIFVVPLHVRVGRRSVHISQKKSANRIIRRAVAARIRSHFNYTKRWIGSNRSKSTTRCKPALLLSINSIDALHLVAVTTWRHHHHRRRLISICSIRTNTTICHQTKVSRLVSSVQHDYCLDNDAPMTVMMESQLAPMTPALSMTNVIHSSPMMTVQQAVSPAPSRTIGNGKTKLKRSLLPFLLTILLILL